MKAGNRRPYRSAGIHGSLVLFFTRWFPPSGREARRDALWEQTGARLGVLHEDGAHGTVLGRLQDFLLGVARGVERFRLSVGVEAKHRRGERFAHGITHALLVIHADTQGASHDPPS